MGQELGNDMLPGGSDPYWEHLVARIHDPKNMAQLVRQVFEENFEGIDPAPLVAFFSSEAGQRFVALEIRTRFEFLSGDREEVAREKFRAAPTPFKAHLSAISEYVEANSLIENNVVGALNSNYLFFRGLAEGGAIELSEEDMLRDVWSQEELTREDTREWLFAFLMQAYEPVSPEAILAYAEISRSPEGQAMNRALFAGFDKMYGVISLSLGMALAKQLKGEAI